MRQQTPGFTVIELLTVIAIMGIVATIAFPRLVQEGTKLTVRSATQEVAAYLAQARATAIATGRPAWFVLDGNLVGVSTTGDTTSLVQATDMQAQHGVTVSAPANPTSIEFDPRGLGRISTKDCSL